MAVMGAEMSQPAPLYVAARSVLLDAVEALEPHIHAVVLVGAQAVYLRTEGLDLPVAPYTTDGDLVLDPRALGTEPDVSAAMEAAGFALATDADGFEQPGAWIAERVIDGRAVLVPVDLIVPAGVSATKRRSARLPGHRKGAARTIPGLEAAILDHDTFEIAPLDPSDGRRFRVEVAGPVALLIAKSFKLRERLDHEARPDRLHDKDAGDAFRLMQATDVRRCVAVSKTLVSDEALGPVCRAGLEHLFDLFRAPRSPGTEMAVSHLRGAVPEARVAGVAVAFVRTLREGLGV